MHPYAVRGLIAMKMYIICRANKQGSGGSGDKSMPVMDKKALAKQRYREKNRRAQARHRERNKVRYSTQNDPPDPLQEVSTTCPQCLMILLVCWQKRLVSHMVLGCALQKTIEDLTARVATLTAENQDLKLENAILSKIGEVKDEHLSKLRHSKVRILESNHESYIAA